MYVVPADHKWATRAIVADVITTTLRSMDLRYPVTTPEQAKLLAEARRKLTGDA